MKTETEILVSIPKQYIPALATAAFLQGWNVSDWAVERFEEHISRSSIPGEEVIVDDDSIVLEKMFTSTGPEEEPADLPVSDFYKDIV